MARNARHSAGSPHMVGRGPKAARRAHRLPATPSVWRADSRALGQHGGRRLRRPPFGTGQMHAKESPPRPKK